MCPTALPKVPDLHDVLDRYVAALAERGSSIRQHLRPGLDSTVVAERLAGHELESPPSIVDWFGYADGIEARPPGGDDFIALFRNVSMLSLDEAIEERTRLRVAAADNAEDAPRGQAAEAADAAFSPSWLPLTQGEPDYALQLAERDDQGAVYALWWDQPPLRVAFGLAEWVSTNLEELTSGAVEVKRSLLVKPRPERPPNECASVSFPVGRLMMTPNVERGADKLATLYAKGGFVGFRLRYLPPGAVPDNRDLEVAQLDLLLPALEDRGVPRSALHPEPFDLSAATREPERHWIIAFGLEPGDEL